MGLLVPSPSVPHFLRVDVPFYGLPLIPGLIDHRYKTVKETFEIPLNHSERMLLSFERYSRAQRVALGLSAANDDSMLVEDVQSGNDSDINEESDHHSEHEHDNEDGEGEPKDHDDNEDKVEQAPSMAIELQEG